MTPTIPTATTTDDNDNYNGNDDDGISDSDSVSDYDNNNDDEGDDRDDDNDDNDDNDGTTTTTTATSAPPSSLPRCRRRHVLICAAYVVSFCTAISEGRAPAARIASVGVAICDQLHLVLSPVLKVHKLETKNATVAECAKQARFDVIMCKSSMCKDCTLQYCTEKCQDVQLQFANCERSNVGIYNERFVGI